MSCFVFFCRKSLGNVAESRERTREADEYSSPYVDHKRSLIVSEGTC
jgi:hypothetical protein